MSLSRSNPSRRFGGDRVIGAVRRNRPDHRPLLRADPRRARWQSWYAGKSAVLRFGLKFGGLMALFYGVALAPYVDGTIFPAYLRANAALSDLILNGLGQDCHLTDTTIRVAGFAMTIRRGCDALEPSWLFAAAVISFPAPFRRKLLGILIGDTFLLALNLVRIVSLYFVGVHWPRLFATFHLEIWPVVFVLAAIAMWVGWIGWARGRDWGGKHAAT